MSGPIVRTGTTPKFWQNWDQVFGSKRGKKSSLGEAKSPETKSAKSAKKASTKSATTKSPSSKSVVGKKARKPAGKKK